MSNDMSNDVARDVKSDVTNGMATEGDPRPGRFERMKVEVVSGGTQAVEPPAEAARSTMIVGTLAWVALFVVLAIFVAGLMVGRTPEYVGKKIEAREVKMAMLAILVLPLMYLGWTAVAVVFPPAVASMANAGPHGFTEVLYDYTSATGNNGSAFGGLTGNTMFYNLTLASSMFVGRFFMIVPAMALAGSLAAKKSIPPSAGTLPTTGGLFVGLVVGVILIIGGLTFFPALALGPIAEHLAMNANTLF